MQMNKGYLLFVTWLCLSVGSILLISSCATTHGGNTDADKAYKLKQYNEAISGFKDQHKKAKGDKKSELAYKIAQSYRFMDDYQKAESWYDKAIQEGYKDPKIKYDYAQVLKMNEKYEEAIKQLQDYKKDAPADNKIDEQVTMLQTYVKSKGDNCMLYEVNNFKMANSAGNDFAPVLLKKEGMVFTSDRDDATGKNRYPRTGLKYSDLFLLPKVKDRKTEKWAPPVKAVEGDINNSENQGQATFDAKGNIMIYTDCNSGLEDGNSKSRKRPNCVLKMAHRAGKGWGGGVTLPFCTDTALFYGHPALSPDGTRLVFALDAPQGLGNHDLYLSTYVKRGNTWSDPVNMGPVINTQGQEMFPSWYNDTTLYFSSDGHTGLGGLDIFMTHGQGVNWAKPIHIPAPLNSGGDDFGITFEDGGFEKGYFTSNRIGSKKDDIYSFSRRPQEYHVKGTVYLLYGNGSKVKAEGAKVSFTNKTKSNDKYTSITVGKDGRFNFTVPNEINFRLFADKRRWIAAKGTFDGNADTKGWICSRDTILDLYLMPSDTIIEIPGIYYDIDKYTLRPESVKALDSLYDILVSYPYMVVELSAHTDCRATYAHNDTLSQKRAEACVDYLVKRGIDKVRLVPKGYGERRLKNTCACEPNDLGPGKDCKEEEHQANRRTEIKILNNDYVPKKIEGEDGDE